MTFDRLRRVGRPAMLRCRPGLDPIGDYIASLAEDRDRRRNGSAARERLLDERLTELREQRIIEQLHRLQRPARTRSERARKGWVTRAVNALMRTPAVLSN